MTVDELFLAAVAKAIPDERAAFLESACQGDVGLRAQVEGLLKSHDAAASFLEQPLFKPPATIEACASGERPGTSIGPYKLLQQIGEGGMGVVWMAEQTQPVQRKVALKVIKPGMDTSQVIARFEAERQALAMMDHVNIARVFDAGATEAGRPYFVMELVHGVPITKYCDDNHLTPRERLELFVPVCQAIQHAHQKGIIHRDIKPSNVMVTLYDGKPVSKVIDFGVAKATEQKLTERTLFTQYGTMVGTLEYMSPEQAEMSALGVDTRSDIYSLGVLLYELLTGNTPLTHMRMKEVAYAEILRMIKEVEPPKPSTRLSESGEALASISANRHMEPAKLTKLVRGELDWIVMKTLEKDRNRRYETAKDFVADVQRYLADEQVLACPPSVGYRLRKFARRNRTGLAVAGLVLFFLVLLGTGAGWAWRDRAARARETELERMARSAEQANHMERAVERAELLQQQGKRGEALAAFERATILARDSEPSIPLRKRIDFLQGFLDAEGKDLDFVARFEAIRREDQTEVDVQKNVFTTAKGYPKLREALKQYEIEVAVTPPDAAVARIQGRSPVVQKIVVAALDECFRFVPHEDAMSRHWFLEVLQKADGDPWRREVRKAWRNVSELERLVKDVNVSRHPANFLVMTTMALPAKSPSRLDFARRVQRAYPDDFWANDRLGSDLRTVGLPLEAIRYHTAALALQPRNPGVYLNRSNAFAASENLAEALADINQAIDLAPRYAMAWRIKGRLLQKMNDMENAEAALRQALVLDRSDTYARSWLVGQMKEAGRHRDVEVELRRAIDIDPKSAKLQNDLGNTLYAQKKVPEAIAAYRQATELDPIKYAKSLPSLGHSLHRLGKLDDAISAFRQAVSLERKTAAASPRPTSLQLSLTNVLDERARQLVTGSDPKSRDPGRAIDLAQEAAALLPPTNKATFRDTLGMAHYRAGNWKAAVEALGKYRTFYKGPDTVVLFFLSMAHARLNEKEQARTFFDQAAQWRMGRGATEEELRRLCAEAAALLGLEVPPTLKEPPVLTPGPGLFKPAAGATLDSGTVGGGKPMVWEFDWSDVPGATKYHLYVTWEKGLTINDPTLSSSSYRWGRQEYLANQNRPGHRWKVRALVHGVWTDWSEERTFDVVPLDDSKPSPKK